VLRPGLAAAEAGRALRRDRDGTVSLLAAVWLPLLALGAVALTTRQVAALAGWAEGMARVADGDELTRQLALVLPWLHRLTAGLVVVSAAAAVAVAWIELRLIVAAERETAGIMLLTGADPGLPRATLTLRAAAVGLAGSLLAGATLVLVALGSALALGGPGAVAGIPLIGPGDALAVAPLLLAVGTLGTTGAAWLAGTPGRLIRPPRPGGDGSSR
jgi:cell division protein FtsX